MNILPAGVIAVLLALRSGCMPDPTSSVQPVLDEPAVIKEGHLVQGAYSTTEAVTQNFVTYRPTDGYGSPVGTGDQDLATFGGVGAVGPQGAGHAGLSSMFFGPGQPPNLAPPISYVKVYAMVFRKANAEDGLTRINTYTNMGLRLTNSGGVPNWEIGRFALVGNPTGIAQRANVSDNLTATILESVALYQRPANANPSQLDPAVNFVDWAWADIPRISAAIEWDYPALAAGETSEMMIRELWIDVYSPNGAKGDDIEVRADPGQPHRRNEIVYPKQARQGVNVIRKTLKISTIQG